VITTAQLRGAGLTAGAVSQRVRAGRLHPLYRGVYAAGHNRLSQEAKWLAAVLAAGPNAVLSHGAAAKHWQIWRGRVDDIDVLVPGNPRPRKGFRVHRARALDRRDVTVHKGIPITTPARTLVDLASVLTCHQLANVIHEAAFRKLLDERAVRAAMTRANGRHNLHVLHKALELNTAGSAGTRSELEDRFLALTSKSGLPEPLVNTRIEDIEVDFHWPQPNLIVEVDGPGHTRPRSQHEDHERDQSLRATGHTILRIPDREIDGGPEAVAARLFRHLPTQRS
jgi:hypothetical protein